MELLPVPKPPTVRLGTLPVSTGLNFLSEVKNGTAYWAMTIIDADGNRQEELAGSIPLWDKKTLEKIGRVAKAYSKESKMPLRLTGESERYGVFGLPMVEILKCSAPTLAELVILKETIVELQMKDYKSVEIYTDASWHWARTVTRVGVGWLVLVGGNVNYGSQLYNKLNTEYAERFAVVEGLKNAYVNVISLVGSDGEIVVRTDSKDTVEWATNIFNGKEKLTFTELPDNGLYQFLSKCVKATKAGSGPKVVFEWVKGHNGNVWNEYADRIALLTARSAELGFRNQKAWNNIQEDIIQTIKVINAEKLVSVNA